MRDVRTIGSAHQATARTRPPARRWLFMLPVLLFAALAVALAWGLTRNPRDIPSTLIGKPVPEFSLPPIEGRDSHGFSSADLAQGPAVVNVFASWCVPCRAEHPAIARLAATGVPVHGINYKDRPEDARAWLAELGDPFTHIGADRDGRVAIDWGVYGVPETFVISREGRIVHKQIGPITPRDLNETILPLIERLRQ